MKSLIRLLVIVNLVVFALVGLRLYQRWAAQTLVEEGRERLLEELNSHSFESLNFPRNRGVAALFSKINSSCGAWPVLESLRRLSAQRPHVPIRVLLSDHFSQEDAELLKENFDLPFQVRRADPALARTWKDIDDRFGYAVLNKTLLKWKQGAWQTIAERSDLREQTASPKASF